jgi:hypothetical protein
MTEAAVSIIGSGSAEAALAARALLAGNGVAHRWLDADGDPVGRTLRERAGPGRRSAGHRLPGWLAARRAGRLRRAVPKARGARIP